MLRIVQSTSSARAKSYYASGDYYARESITGQELPGQWRGKGAGLLGLKGPISRVAWDRLCDNQRPDTGARLTPRRKAERRVGYDLNFHCPKSLSLLYGLTRDPRLLDAFTASVEDTMREIEAEARARVRANGQNEDRVTGNLVYGQFVHLTARPEDGVPDPHLHAHCFVLNATQDFQGNQWKALQLGEIKRDAPYFEAVFHSLLARRMERLGLSTTRTRTGWELEGIDNDTLRQFSRRTVRIESLAKARGITDPRRKAELGARTRAAKAGVLSMDELASLWRARLDDPESLDALARRIGSTPIAEDDRAAQQAARLAIEHGFERRAVLPERTLLAQALRRGLGRASRQAVEEVVRQEPLLRATRRGRELVTTAGVLDEERAVLDFARQGRAACRPIDPGRTGFTRDWLNSQQQAAVRHVLTSTDRVMIIRGVAGAGKTSALEELREALRDAGVSVLAFAPSTGASRGELRRVGFESADTIARLLVDADLQNQTRDSLILIDEAGLVGTRTMRDVFDLAQRQHARVLLVGDERQHGPVERGSALRLLEEHAGLRPAEIKEIQRQRAQYKHAIVQLSEGRTEAGFGTLDRLGWIREVADAQERDHALADAYVETVRAGESALVVSPTHAEGERITSQIRARLREEGLIKGPERGFPCLSPANLTTSEKRDPLNYQPGDVLVFHQNARGFRRGQRVTVDEHRGTIPTDQAERFTVYHAGKIDLAVGDRVRVTRNGLSKDGKARLSNGDVLSVTGFTRRGDLVASAANSTGKRLVIARDFGHLAHGFVVTSHASQGRTVDRVLVGQSGASFAASSREQFYVSASRGRRQVLVYTDDKADLLRSVARDEERLSATELAGHRIVRHQQLAERERATHEREELRHER